MQWLLPLDPLYNFLLTFGLTLLLVDLVKRRYGVSGLPYQRPEVLQGRLELFGIGLPAVPGLRARRSPSPSASWSGC